MKNNNAAIVRKITGRALKSDKRRNFFIIAAIALTSLMLTSVFSVGMSMYESFAISGFRAEGTRMHMAIANPSPAQIETLRSLEYVRHIGTSHRVGVTTDPFFDVWYVDEINWTTSQAPTFAHIIGHYAREENEIMISRAKLASIGVTEPYIGMEISLPFAAVTRDQFFEMPDAVVAETKTFVVAAIYTEFVSQRGATFTPLFVSRAFAEKHGQLSQENRMAHILFTNQNRALQYAERLVQDLPIYAGQNYGTHPALGESDTGISYVALAVGIVALFMMATGFLLIYNVMYISVSKDVRFYGLLKTLGTTPRQLRRIVNGQILRLYILGLPIGLLLAAALSFAIVPAMVGHIDTGTVVSFSPFIYIGGAVFTLLTAYVGAATSARKAAKVSPIEAVRYAGEQNLNVRVRSSAKGKPYRMAWRNVFRERKRALLVLVSLFLGITVFTTVMTLVYSQDIGGSIEYWHVHDIDISTFGEGQDDFGPVGMDRGTIEEISAIPGVTSVREDTLTLARLVYSDSLRAYTDWLLSESQSAEHFRAMPREDFLGNLFLGIRGIDTSLLAELTADFAAPVDFAAFERGEIAFLDATFLGVSGMPESVISRLQTQLAIQIGEGRYPSAVEIIGTVNFTPRTGMTLALGDPVRIIMSNTYLESRFGQRAVMHLGVNTEQGMDGEVYRQIEEMTAGTGMSTASSYMARLAMEEAGRTILVMGASISGVLALIGLFNFINVIAVGLLVRKREFAALESVGMSKKQMRAMLRYEGAIYWGMVILTSISVGTAAAYGLFRLIHSQDPMQYPAFIYPLLPVLLVFGFIILICSVTPALMYRGISKMTLVERLREAE